ncbi:hypothetical protein BJF83_22430 [Nocardiopsis sp. CNR-923]|uniref:hypothetical protein n=1 Tax=Nocardiopsis sp. CNR-923 TaxID=1904965 RepID=UPI0009672DBD|nr:hypothetical protein [Nocardiopsis sp. CNR-923]OLT25841.1 hypothetical protein BJF83_22430 [Nocardiopsis sp. CNR-923]
MKFVYSPRCSDTRGAACCGADLYVNADSLQVLRRVLDGEWPTMSSTELAHARALRTAIFQDGSRVEVTE